MLVATIKYRTMCQEYFLVHFTPIANLNNFLSDTYLSKHVSMKYLQHIFSEETFKKQNAEDDGQDKSLQGIQWDKATLMHV